MIETVYGITFIARLETAGTMIINFTPVELNYI